MAHDFLSSLVHRPLPDFYIHSCEIKSESMYKWSVNEAISSPHTRRIFFVYSTLYSAVQLCYAQLCINIVGISCQVTVSTCTCKDVFTIITTKDQSGGIGNSYSTDDQDTVNFTIYLCIN